MITKTTKSIKDAIIVNNEDGDYIAIEVGKSKATNVTKMLRMMMDNKIDLSLTLAFSVDDASDLDFDEMEELVSKYNVMEAEEDEE